MSKKYEVTLRFRTAEEKRFFLGQLSDGWGENYVDLKCRGDMNRARFISVDPTVDVDLWDHHVKMRNWVWTEKP